MSHCLHHNELGLIGQCASGCCLHLYFGNVGLRLSLPELRQWRMLVRKRCAHHAPLLADTQCRCVSLPGPSPDVVFLFSLQELYWLLDLLTNAMLLRETGAVLRQLARPHLN